MFNFCEAGILWSTWQKNSYGEYMWQFEIFLARSNSAAEIKSIFLKGILGNLYRILVFLGTQCIVLFKDPVEEYRKIISWFGWNLMQQFKFNYFKTQYIYFQFQAFLARRAYGLSYIINILLNELLRGFFWKYLKIIKNISLMHKESYTNQWKVLSRSLYRIILILV